MWHSNYSVVSSVSWSSWLWEGWRHTCLHIPDVSIEARMLLLCRCCLIWGVAWLWTHCVAEGQLWVLFLLLAGVPFNWLLGSLCSAAPARCCSCWAERWGLSASSQNENYQKWQKLTDLTCNILSFTLHSRAGNCSRWIVLGYSLR